MKLDLTPLSHAGISAVIQILVGLLTKNWWLGGLLSCVWWVAREHTQAEYRWIAAYGNGKRANMPEWGGFDPRVWNAGSLLDFCVPIAACLCIWFLNII